ncbi:hypothetical protein [Microbacterium rhizomatis]|uniref:Uncharacterized protein n=1 Tax=Microbacterium rhizomatis TaxID=1631477 RepID=A0A5J5J590_9MICO|nr:hypothetical protein [Microbacterium rhizomatis]KAA9111256.1 hypothetical protein F6B43_06595 [Microbacterium rhizomatis]
MISVRQVLTALGFAFTAYLAGRSLYWTGPVQYPLVMYATTGLYLVTAWLCLFQYRRRPAEETGPPAGIPAPDRLPIWACVLATAAAVLMPTTIALAVGPDVRTAPYGTWAIGAIGVLMVIVMVRRRPWVAWAGIVIMGVQSMIWMGVLPALALGLVGSIVWVSGTQVMIVLLDRAALDAAHLATLQRAASAWQASQTVRQRERRLQVQRALVVAGPVLTRTVASGGELDEGERLEARIAEGRLRDELRGPRLLDDEVRAQLDAVRRRGTAVTVLDEGGLEGLDERSLTQIRSRLADTLRSASSDRLYIRTSPHDRIAVTVVGRSGAGAGLSDEDAVDLWAEIPHSPGEDA